LAAHKPELGDQFVIQESVAVNAL